MLPAALANLEWRDRELFLALVSELDVASETELLFGSKSLSFDEAKLFLRRNPNGFLRRFACVGVVGI